MPAKDPTKRRATWRAWYQRTKHLRTEHGTARLRENRARRRREIAAWYVELKSRLACVCGESHPACIQFHHPDPSAKEASIADAVRAGWSRVRLQRELEKCVVHFANCHANLHAKASQ